MEEIFDIIDTQGNPTGETVTREKAHAEGIPHRTAHIWDHTGEIWKNRSAASEAFHE